MVLGPVPLAVAAGDSLQNTSTAEGSHEGGTGKAEERADGLKLEVGVVKPGDRDKNVEIELGDPTGVDDNVGEYVGNVATGASLETFKKLLKTDESA